MCPPRGTGSRKSSKVVLGESYSSLQTKSTAIPSAKRYYEYMLTVAKYNEFSLPRDAIKDRLTVTRHLSGFLEPTNEGKLLGHERE